MLNRVTSSLGLGLVTWTLAACGGVPKQDPPSDVVSGAGGTSTLGFGSERGGQRATMAGGAGNSGADSGRGGSSAAATGGTPQTAVTSGGFESAGAPSLAGAKAMGSGGSSLS